MSLDARRGIHTPRRSSRELHVGGARRVPLEDALDAYWAEMVPRAATKVDKSRRAADLLHSPAALAVAHDVTRAAAAAAEREGSN